MKSKNRDKLRTIKDEEKPENKTNVQKNKVFLSNASFLSVYDESNFELAQEQNPNSPFLLLLSDCNDIDFGLIQDDLLKNPTLKYCSTLDQYCKYFTNKKNLAGDNAFTFAIRTKNIEIIKYVISQKIKIEKKDIELFRSMCHDKNHGFKEVFNANFKPKIKKNEKIHEYSHIFEKMIFDFFSNVEDKFELLQMLYIKFQDLENFILPIIYNKYNYKHEYISYNLYDKYIYNKNPLILDMNVQNVTLNSTIRRFNKTKNKTIPYLYKKYEFKITTEFIVYRGFNVEKKEDIELKIKPCTSVSTSIDIASGFSNDPDHVFAILLPEGTHVFCMGNQIESEILLTIGGNLFSVENTNIFKYIED